MFLIPLQINIDYPSQPQKRQSLVTEMQPILGAQIQPEHTSMTLFIATCRNTSVLVDKWLMP